MRRILTLTALALVATAAPVVAAVTVNCNRGESLNRTLAQLNRRTPATVRVNGTCVEYVAIRGFNELTLKGAPGAMLLQPSTDPGIGLILSVLTIDASRSITIDGFMVKAAFLPSSITCIGIKGSIDVRLRNLAIEGGSLGIIAAEGSQVSIAGVTARDPGYAPVGVYDASDVHIENCLLEHSTGEGWHVGIDVGAAHVTLRGITIRNMQVGMNAHGGGIIDLADFPTYYPHGVPSEVVIESPAGTNYYGVQIRGGASLNLGTKLRITNAGQRWGGNTGGAYVADGSTLNAGGNLEVSGSQGQGVFVTNTSNASLAGSRITGSLHGGLVAVNQSTVTVEASASPTEISGNATDLFCDSRSLIAGGANVAGTPTTQCSHLLAGAYESIP